MNGSMGTMPRGMSLVEVLVALLVLGIGVMGYAALQLNAVRMSEDTYSRSQAMAVAQDLIERMRANVNSDAVLAFYTDAADWSGTPTSPAKSCSDPAVPCSPDAIAESDIYQSRRYAQTMLPTGDVAVSKCNGVTCVTVAWNQTTPANCKQTERVNGDRGANANCVIVEFIP